MSRIEMKDGFTDKLFIFISLIMILISIFFIVRSHNSFVADSEIIEGYLSEVIYQNSPRRYLFTTSRYYGVYEYNDDDGNTRYIKAPGFNLSENAVPKSVTIYYNKKLNEVKIKQKLCWIIEWILTTVAVLIFAFISLIYKKKY